MPQTTGLLTLGLDLLLQPFLTLALLSTGSLPPPLPQPPLGSEWRPRTQNELSPSPRASLALC